MKKVIQSMKPVEQCDWGPVYVMKGRYKGKVGYYDDDDCDGAIVYLDGGITGFGRYRIIKHEYLYPADVYHSDGHGLTR